MSAGCCRTDGCRRRVLPLPLTDLAAGDEATLPHRRGRSGVKPRILQDEGRDHTIESLHTVVSPRRVSERSTSGPVAMNLLPDIDGLDLQGSSSRSSPSMRTASTIGVPL